MTAKATTGRQPAKTATFVGNTARELIASLLREHPTLDAEELFMMFYHRMEKPWERRPNKEQVYRYYYTATATALRVEARAPAKPTDKVGDVKALVNSVASRMMRMTVGDAATACEKMGKAADAVRALGKSNEIVGDLITEDKLVKLLL